MERKESEIREKRRIMRALFRHLEGTVRTFDCMTRYMEDGSLLKPSVFEVLPNTYRGVFSDLVCTVLELNQTAETLYSHYQERLQSPPDNTANGPTADSAKKVEPLT